MYEEIVARGKEWFEYLLDTEFKTMSSKLSKASTKCPHGISHLSFSRKYAHTHTHTHTHTPTFQILFSVAYSDATVRSVRQRLRGVASMDRWMRGKTVMQVLLDCSLRTGATQDTYVLYVLCLSCAFYFFLRLNFIAISSHTIPFLLHFMMRSTRY